MSAKMRKPAWDDPSCGYVAPGAAEIVRALDDDEVRRLAAMAVTFFDSEWSDRDRDLFRGVASVLRREGRS